MKIMLIVQHPRNVVNTHPRTVLFLIAVNGIRSRQSVTTKSFVPVYKLYVMSTTVIETNLTDSVITW